MVIPAQAAIMAFRGDENRGPNGGEGIGMDLGGLLDHAEGCLLRGNHELMPEPFLRRGCEIS